MTAYLKFKQKYSADYISLTKTYNRIAIIRLFVAFVLFFLLYKSFQTNDIRFIFYSVLVAILFILLLKIHKKISWKRKVKKYLISINNDEIVYLKKEGMPFERGDEYIDFKHFYAFDLDFFGANSLFHNINRTATYIGSKKLAHLLLTLLPNNEIQLNQQAIAELAKKIEWRQYLLALAKIIKDNRDSYQKLIDWAENKQEKIYRPLNVVFHITPVVFIISMIAIFLAENPLFTYLASAFFLINLVLLVTQLKKIKQEIIDADKISEIVKQYGLIIEKIEREKFGSPKLNILKENLICKSGLASSQIKKLASLFSNMQSIQNGIGAILFNGAFLFHIHILNHLLNWKRECSKHINDWLEVIGEFEALNSLANFSYNNPTFAFPALNENYEFVFEELGHPLIRMEKRICNNVAFTESTFIILTGSNMSGKSTFLRTLGTNMVLAGIGSPICSSNANIHPLNIIVSMRQTDSLFDNESYFFAEVNRLKQIMDKLQSEICFVLLDEILKGTNSDDKHTGTIEVIKKIVSKNAIGAIATHDIAVCQITNDYPKILTNKCFEVEIVNNDLVFDYRLKDGICKNRSATFLMRKMKII